MYYESGITPCKSCGASPTFTPVVSVDDKKCTLEPRCGDCLVNRVMTGVLAEPKTKKRKAPSRRMKQLADKQEREVMDDLGGRTQPASGARSGYKGDGRVYDRFRVEAKFTFAKAFSLTRAVLNKIRGECAGKETPALVVDFKDKRTGRTDDRWVVIPYKVWKKDAAADDS
jgi:hypothetical protein